MNSEDDGATQDLSGGMDNRHGDEGGYNFLIIEYVTGIFARTKMGGQRPGGAASHCPANPLETFMIWLMIWFVRPGQKLNSPWAFP